MSDDITVVFEPEEVPSLERKKVAVSSPNLYLEYLENKQKVKKEEVGKDYVLDSDDDHQDEEETSLSQPIEEEEQDPKEEEEEQDPKEEEEQDQEEEEEEQDQEEEEQETEVRRQQPSLSELKKGSKVKVRSNDYKYPLEEENEVTKKRNKVFFHYEVLKRMHPEAQIPECTSYSDPDQMEEKYELLAKKYSLDSSVENWKRYIIVGILGFEVCLGKLNFDMEGFAQHQISSINTYDQLLVEMAEKSYVPTSERWPVEMRLIMMFTMNVVIFLVSKMIMKQTGVNLIGTINKATGISNDLQHSPSLKDP